VALGDAYTGKAARLDCGDGNQIGMSAATVAGVYVLGAKGIYRYALDTKDADIAAIPEDQALVLEVDPIASKTIDKGEEHESAIEVKKDEDGAWCKSREEAWGDYFAESDCFVPGKGIVRAGRESSGGSTFVTTFTAL
jgi:VCBS repeat-containing protein